MITNLYKIANSCRNAKRNKDSERGVVLVYIFLAIALIAALSYAVTQSNRGGISSLSKDKARLYASEIIEFANVISNAVTQLRLRGVLETQLCFDDPRWGAFDYNHAGCATNANKVFHPEGAGVIWAEPPFESMDNSASPDNIWHITGVNHVENVGTTCASDTCAELILFVNELKLEVCQKLNELLGVTDANVTPPDETDFNDDRFLGVFGNEDTIGSGNVLEGKRTGCFREVSSGTYHYYKVLLAR